MPISISERIQAFEHLRRPMRVVSCLNSTKDTRVDHERRDISDVAMANAKGACTRHRSLPVARIDRGSHPKA
jgi:hypothetical protein